MRRVVALLAMALALWLACAPGLAAGALVRYELEVSSDVDPDIYAEVRQLRRYTAQYLDFDQQTMLDLLLPSEPTRIEQHAVGQMHYIEDGDALIHLCVYDDGESYGVRINGRPAGGFAYGKMDMSREYPEAYLPYRLSSGTLERDDLMDMCAAQELEFMSRSAALELVLDVFEQIGRDNLILLRQFGVTREQAAADSEGTGGARDYYQIYMAEELDGIGINTEHFSNTLTGEGEYALLGPYIAAVIDAEGIKQMICSNYLAPTPSSDYEPVIPYEQALEVVKSQYAQRFLTRRNILNSAELIYHVRATGDAAAVELVPVWAFTIARVISNGNSYSNQYLLVDALTGELVHMS